MVVREIAQAFLTADRPHDVYQLALDRVTPLVGAAFACVYLLDDDSDLMHLEAVHNWPERYARFLGEMRVRLGSGPSGKAASDRRAIDIPDVFSDSAFEDWREVAEELGFRSIVALPLETGDEVHGAVAFYFAATGGATTEGRHLLRVIADQLAAAAQKAHLIDDLQRTNSALLTTNSEMEKQYAALLEARRLQDEFLSNVSHELRTPLTAVLGYLALIEEGIAGPVTKDQEDTLRAVKSSSEQLLELIGDLLELTSLKRGELAVHVAEFDPRDVIRDAIAGCNGPRKGVNLVVDNTPALPLAKQDKRKVTRLVAALIGNAFKFTETGEVRVTVFVKNDKLTYRVSDTGVGISPEAHRFVFDEFRQEDGSATRKYGGSGLGLAIARRLARLLGGDVTMSSQRGKGSTFQAEIPLSFISIK